LSYLCFVDVKKIVSEEVLPDSVVAGIARVSNLRQSRLVVTPNGNKVVIAPAGEVDLTHYYDTVNNATFELDHMTLVKRSNLLLFVSLSTNLFILFRKPLLLIYPQTKKKVSNKLRKRFNFVYLNTFEPVFPAITPLFLSIHRMGNLSLLLLVKE
jgi:hypothetical protein